MLINLNGSATDLHSKSAQRTRLTSLTRSFDSCWSCLDITCGLDASRPGPVTDLYSSARHLRISEIAVSLLSWI